MKMIVIYKKSISNSRTEGSSNAIKRRSIKLDSVFVNSAMDSSHHLHLVGIFDDGTLAAHPSSKT